MKHRWVYDIVVLSFIVYFAVNGVISILDARLPADPAAELPPVAAAKTRSEVTRPLQDYAVVSERNLFGGTGTEQASSAAEAVNPDKIPGAAKSLGLRLVGTVVTDISSQNLAFIEDLAARKQEVAHEGDRVKQVLVKRILRQSVVVNAGNRDEMLSLLQSEEGPAGPPASSGSSRPRPRHPGTSLFPSTQQRPAAVEELTADVTRLKQEMRIHPHLEENKFAGFQVSDVKPGSLFAKKGLKSGDVVQRVDDQVISSPEQEKELYERLANNEQVVLEIKRGQTTRQVFFLKDKDH